MALRTNHPTFVVYSGARKYNLKMVGSITNGLLMWVPLIDESNPPMDIWGRNVIAPINDGSNMAPPNSRMVPKWFGTTSRSVTDQRYLQTTLLQEAVVAYTVMAWVRGTNPQMGVRKSSAPWTGE